MGVEKNPRVRIYHLPLMVSNWRLPRPETTLHLDGMYRQTYSWLKNREKKIVNFTLNSSNPSILARFVSLST